MRLSRSRLFRRAASLALALLLTVAAVWLWSQEDHDTLTPRGVTVNAEDGVIVLEPEVVEALGVETVAVAETMNDERVTVQACVEVPPRKHAYASSQLRGRVTAVHVRRGVTVPVDQPLVEVQSLELETLTQNLLAARQNVSRLVETVADLEAASRRGAVSEQQLADVHARHQEAINAQEIARRKLESLGIAEPNGGMPVATQTLTVRSPMAGLVTDVRVRPGQVIAPEDRLVEVRDPDAIWVRLDVLEKDLPRVEIGQTVFVRWSGSAPDASPLQGTIRMRGASLDRDTREGIAWADFDSPVKLLPGMVGMAEVVVSPPRKGVTIPTTALVSSGAERFAFVEQEPGRYLRKYLTVGRQTHATVELPAGQLNPGERIVTTGCQQLVDLLPEHAFHLSPEAVRNIGLRVEETGAHRVSDVISLTGIVEVPPDRRARIASPFGGIVRHIHVDRGQAVERGDVVAEIVSLEWQDLQLDFLRAHLQHEVLSQTRERLKALAENGNMAVSRRQLRETEAAVEAARIQRDGLRRKLELLGLTPAQVDDIIAKRNFAEALPLRAPLGGVVAEINTILGEGVKAEDALIEIHDLEKAQIRVEVPERDWQRIHVGQTARVRLLGVGETETAHVARTGRTVEAAARSVPVWLARRPEMRRVLPAGTLTRVALVVGEGQPVLAVPLEAIWREGSRAFVFVQEEGGAFARRPVRTGRSDDQFVEVTEGLEAGEPVAVAGVAGLQTAYASVK